MKERARQGQDMRRGAAGSPPVEGTAGSTSAEGSIHVSRRGRMTGSPAWWLENDPDDLFDHLYVIKEEAVGATMGRDDAEAASV